MEPFLVLAERNRKKAAEIVARTGLVGIWESVGAEVRPVGSFRMGLLCKHRDIDFHIYSSPLNVSDSFRAMAKLAENGAVEHIEYANLLHTEERCLEWHVRYRDEDEEDWQIDMIHIVGGSRYDGYFERMADCISETLTEETRRTILRLKYETPDTEKIMGVEYYRAVLQDGVRTYAELQAWRRTHPVSGVWEWMP